MVEESNLKVYFNQFCYKANVLKVTKETDTVYSIPR